MVFSWMALVKLLTLWVSVSVAWSWGTWTWVISTRCFLKQIPSEGNRIIKRKKKQWNTMRPPHDSSLHLTSSPLSPWDGIINHGANQWRFNSTRSNDEAPATCHWHSPGCLCEPWLSRVNPSRITSRPWIDRSSNDHSSYSHSVVSLCDSFLSHWSGGEGGLELESLIESIDHTRVVTPPVLWLLGLAGASNQAINCGNNGSLIVKTGIRGTIFSVSLCIINWIIIRSQSSSASSSTEGRTDRRGGVERAAAFPNQIKSSIFHH